jgi:integrase
MTGKKGSIEALPSGRFRLRMRLVGVGRKTVSNFDTEEEADAYRKTLLDILAKEEPNDGISVADFGAKVLTSRELSGKISDPGSDWSRWQNHFVGDDITKLAVRAARDVHIEDWAERLEAKGLSRQTRVHCLNLLRTIFKAAKKKRLIRDNPCSGIVIEKEKRTEEPWTFLTPDEQVALIAATPKPLDAIVEFAIGSGLRSGELVTLRLADVDVESEDPHVVVRYGAPPDKPTKGGKPRRVELFGMALSAMKRWLAGLREYCPGNPLKLAFPGPHGAFRSHDPVLRWDLWKGRPQKGTPCEKGYRSARTGIVERAGIARDLRWHDLRHTCASSLVSGWWGRMWTLAEVQAVLGHESITTTERYAHLADTATKKAARETRLAALETSSAPGPRWSTPLPPRSEIALFFPERDTRFELATFGLGSRRSTN